MQPHTYLSRHPYGSDDRSHRNSNYRIPMILNSDLKLEQLSLFGSNRSGLLKSKNVIYSRNRNYHRYDKILLKNSSRNSSAIEAPKYASEQFNLIF